MTDNVRPLPATNVSLDLDAYVEEAAANKAEPFTSKVGGRVVLFQDPEDLDWQDVIDIETPVDFLRYAVSEEDREHLFTVKMSLKAMNFLMESYFKHYGIDKRIAEAKRAQRRGF